ncbi:hypothetical protein V8C37DRAFT_373175 [Trichoderma ceciliae]
MMLALRQKKAKKVQKLCLQIFVGESGSLRLGRQPSVKAGERRWKRQPGKANGNGMKDLEQESRNERAVAPGIVIHVRYAPSLSSIPVILLFVCWIHLPASSSNYFHPVLLPFLLLLLLAITAQQSCHKVTWAS